MLLHRTQTLHWKLCNKLAKDYPSLNVDSESFFVKDGHVYTSAGVSSGIDLALALIEEDFGRALALEVARELVVYLKRPGMKDRITVELLAEQALMSPRNFARVFNRETGTEFHPYFETSTETI